MTSAVIELEAQAEVNNLEYEGEVDSALNVTTSRDYRQLYNKPSINGTELYDNYNEIDPTVPNWAKREEPKPMSLEEIDALFNDW